MTKLERHQISDILGLTPLQAGMLFHTLAEGDTEIYHEQLSLSLRGTVKRLYFEQAWQHVMATNEMLHTVFRWSGLEQALQIILKEYTWQPQYGDLSRLPPAEQEIELELLKKNERHKRFNLEEIPFRVLLCERGHARYELIINHHHILYDGWSNGIILKEFLAAYNALATGALLTVPAKTPFKSFLHWLKEGAKNSEEVFWRGVLHDFASMPPLPIIKKNGLKKEKMFTSKWDKGLSAQVYQWAQDHHQTVASMLYTVWGMLLLRYCNSDDVMMGTTVSGRTAAIPGIENMVGLFINTLPLRVKTTDKKTIHTLLEQVQEHLTERERFSHTPLVDIQKWQEQSGESLFTSLVVIENYPLDRDLHGGVLTIEGYAMAAATNYELTVGIMLTNELVVNFSFNQEVVSWAAIERLANHLQTIMQKLLADPDTRVVEVEILTYEEKHTLLELWNDTTVEYPPNKTVAHIFLDQVAQRRDAIGLIQRTQEGFSEFFTYGLLNQQAEQIALILQHLGVVPDEVVAIGAEPSVEMVVGLLGILLAGGAYLPLDCKLPPPRLQTMLADSQAQWLIHTKTQSPLAKILLANQPHLNLVALPVLPGPKGIAASVYPGLASQPVDLAYIIYTSGTTGKSKGVAVIHEGLVNFILWRLKTYSFSQWDVTLQLLSYAFDGFGTNFYSSLLSGGSLVIVPQEREVDFSFIKETIHCCGVTHTSLVPGLYEGLMASIEGAECASLRLLVLAGEQPQRTLLAKSQRLFPKLHHIIEYGPTEASITVTAQLLEPGDDFPSLGKPIANTRVYLLDRYNRPVPWGVPGEIVLAGAGLSRGYLNQPELTAETFLFMVQPGKENDGLWRVYRTGDLARWRENGTLEFLGRLDNQIKLRGYRLELGDIETQLLLHPKVKSALVTVLGETQENQFLCAYIVSHEPVGEAELRDFVASRLPVYMQPSYFVFLEKMPLTANGKIAKKNLPMPILRQTNRLSLPENELEVTLLKIWNEVLALNSKNRGSGLGVEDNFFRSGGHSLKAARVVFLIEREMKVHIGVRVLFEYPTIRSLATFIQKTTWQQLHTVEKAEAREYYPLSYAQKRLYIAHYAETGSIGYNVQNMVHIEGQLTDNILLQLEKTFQKLIQRHESLRTVFLLINDMPVQRVCVTVPFKLAYVDLMGRNTDINVALHEAIHAFILPFDLARPPLIRAGLFKLAEHTHLLLTDMHHIIADAFSMGLLIKEFSVLFGGESLAPLAIQYSDYAQWQNTLLNTSAGYAARQREEQFWLGELSGPLPFLHMPFDFPRPATLHYEGASLPFTLTPEITRVLQTVAACEEVTLFMLLLAGFHAWLARVCDQEDILIGIPIAGRLHPDLQNVFGLLVNMLVTRHYPTAEKSFRAFLDEVKKKTLAAYENQDYPYEILVDKVGHREAGRKAFFDAVLVWEDFDFQLENLVTHNQDAEQKTSLLRLKPYPYPKVNAPFDFILTGFLSRGQEGVAPQMNFMINYSTALFKAETIAKLAHHFTSFCDVIGKNPDVLIGDIQLTHDLIAAVPVQEEDGDFAF